MGETYNKVWGFGGTYYRVDENLQKKGGTHYNNPKSCVGYYCEFTPFSVSFSLLYCKFFPLQIPLILLYCKFPCLYSVYTILK